MVTVMDPEGSSNDLTSSEEQVAKLYVIYEAYQFNVIMETADSMPEDTHLVWKYPLDKVYKDPNDVHKDFRIGDCSQLS